MTPSTKKKREAEAANATLQVRAAKPEALGSMVCLPAWNGWHATRLQTAAYQYMVCRELGAAYAVAGRVAAGMAHAAEQHAVRMRWAGARRAPSRAVYA